MTSTPCVSVQLQAAGLQGLPSTVLPREPGCTTAPAPAAAPAVPSAGRLCGGGRACPGAAA